jgi:carboxylate-amine ligase
MQHDYSYGIEEEFFLVDPNSRDLAADVPAGFMRSCRRELGEQVQEEMKQAQVEVATKVLRSSEEGAEALAQLRGRVGDIAAQFGLRLMAAGTHPFAAWRDTAITAKPRYERLLDDFQIVGRRNLVSGLHVHVSVPEGVDRVALMNRLMPWTPLLLALSTSSPFWDGRTTGLMSYRQAAYDEWPRSGIPDPFEDEARYAQFARLLVGCGAMESDHSLWWAIRPSAKFPTLELRITDACTRLQDSLAIAAAFRCLVRAHVHDTALGAGHGSLTRRIVDENRWRAKRFGVAASFIDEARACNLPLAESLAELQSLLAPHAAVLGCESELRRLHTIARSGTSADAQLEVYRRERDARAPRSEALRSVVDWLLQATAMGVARPEAEPSLRFG